jgi:eukaryotic-like serine/threonine-protein kinase
MHLSTGSRLGPYEITGEIGAGGMGEVYRARDSRLGREVAIKVLPAEVSQDPARLVRFEREARTASALNHRNIVTIHDFSSENGQAWLVMELIRGSSLREVLASGAIPLKRLLPIAAGVSDGLTSAHGAGLVHRDLKPENIMITESGTPKILDFGLVKQVSRSDPDQSTEVHVSRTGVVMGTAAYMSPEQARGDELDFRTDQFSLGAILYEAATGVHPFRRATAVDTLAAILNDDPKPLPHTLPEAFGWIVERCLAKNPLERYGSTADLAQDLARLERGPSTAVTAARPARRRVSPWLLLPAALAAGATLGLLAPWRRTPAGTALPVQAALATPDIAEVLLDDVGLPLALSPDGRHLAIYGADGTGATGLWVRDLATGTTRKLAEGAFSAGWSPDNNAIAYFADGKLKTIDVGGGPARSVCPARPEGTPSWHGDTILFSQYSYRPGLYAVNAQGGTPRLIVAPTANSALPWWPQFLPDGKRFLYLKFVPSLETGLLTHELRIASLDGTDELLVGTMDSRAIYASGRLLYVRDGTLLAQPFDPESGRLSGEAQPVVDGVHHFSRTGTAAFTVSDNGVLAWRVARRPVRLAWFDRSGAEQETIDTAVMRPDGRLSPDGQRYAVGVADPKQGSSDVWIYDLQRRSGERLTYRALDEGSPVWAPDGRTIYYRSDGGGGPPDVFRWILGQKDGTLFYRGRAVEEPHDVAPDGRSLLFTEARQVEGADAYVLPLTPNSRPNELLTTPFNEYSPRYSPDGRWIAYSSDASGAPEIYLRPVNGPASAIRVSQQGGTRPRWGKGGRQLYFLAGHGKLMSVAIGADGTPGTPEMLFQAAAAVDFDAAADGSRFIIQLAEHTSEPVVQLLLNWPARLEARTPSR